MKKYIPNDDKKFPSRQNSEPGPLSIPEFKDEELYEVEQILTSRNKPKTGIIEYKVKSKGYSNQHNQWVTAENITPVLIDEFNQKTSSSVPATRKTNMKRKNKTIRRKTTTTYLE